MVSPSVVVTTNGGFASAQTTHSITPTDPDLVLFRTLTNKGELDEAMRLCLERLLKVRDEGQRLRWNRDAAIVERLRGRADSSLIILASTYTLAEAMQGVPFGKHLHGLARSLQMLDRHDDALVSYGGASHYLKGEPILRAQADTNTGRCLTAMRRPEESHPLFERALTVAESHSDLLLQGEVLESMALAFEAEGKFDEGFDVAAKSVSILSPTPYEAAFIESSRTRARLKEKLSAGTR